MQIASSQSTACAATTDTKRLTDFLNMACRGGCVGGGGQPCLATDEVRAQRTAGIYTDDEKCTLRMSHLNPEVQALYKDYEQRAMQCIGRSGIKQRERGRICGISASCLGHSTSERHYRNMLARFDIDVFLHRTRDGRIHGATFIDHSTKCAFKASELGSFRLDDLIAADEGGQWQKKSAHSHDASEDQSLGLVGAALAGMSKSSSKSQEKDMKDKKRKRKLKR